VPPNRRGWPSETEPGSTVIAAASSPMVGHRATAIEDVTLGDEADQAERAQFVRRGHVTGCGHIKDRPALRVLYAWG